MSVVYTERQPQSEELLRGVPEEVIALFGVEGSLAIEEHVETLHVLSELMSLPDPMKEDFPIRSELELSESVQEVTKAAVLEVVRVKPIAQRNPLEEEVGRVTTESTRVIRDSLAFLLDNLRGVRTQTADQSEGLSIWQTWLEVLDDDDTELVIDEANQLHDDLMSLASQLPYPKISADIELLVKTELLARDLGTIAIGAQARPDLARVLLKQRKANALGKRVLTQLHIAGEASPEVGTVYRPAAEIEEDLVRRDVLVESFSNVRKKGSALHGQMNTVIRRVVGRHAEELIGLLSQIYNANQEVTQQAGNREGNTGGGLETAVTVEEYITSHAQTLESVLRTDKFKLSSEIRRTLQKLTDHPIAEALKRSSQENRAPVRAERQTPVATDERFRRACKVAKDILRGGSRLKYPNAQKLARDLHNLRFEETGQVRLEQGEGGLVIAILADEISDFVDTIKRVNLAPNRQQDVQVQKLQSERPEQFTAIKEFDLVASVYKLEQILDNPHYRNRLINILSSGDIEQVQARIQALAKEFRRAEEEPQEVQ